jgi:putative ABC transport system permease protein
VHQLRLAIRNISAHNFRSIIIFLVVMGVVGLLVSATLVIKGINYSLDSGLKRLGADLIVVPLEGASQIETALLMGKPTKFTMNENHLQTIRNLPGVEIASPQIYLSTLYGASCCSASEAFLVVYDPVTDFTITPWLEKHLGRVLNEGEIIGGCYISEPLEGIFIYGYQVTLAGNLEATGTGMDQTIFMTIETALAIAKSSVTTAEQPLVIPEDRIGAILVKVSSGADSHRVALNIYKSSDEIAALESPNLFGIYRQQITGLLWGLVAFTVILWVLAAILIGMIFSMVANERRREIAVMQAVGATRNFIMRSILFESGVLALTGALAGITVSTWLLYLFRNFITGSLKMPFLFPDFGSSLLLFGTGLVLALITITIAVLVPAFRVSRQELAIAMRE